MEQNNNNEIYTPKTNEVKKYPKVGRTRDEHKFKRTYSLDIKLSPLEKEKIEELAEVFNFNSMSAFVRNRIFNGKEKFIDNYFDEKFKGNLITEQMLSELKKIGVNVNQCTKKLNSLSSINKIDVKDLEKIISNFSNEISSIKNQLERILND